MQGSETSTDITMDAPYPNRGRGWFTVGVLASLYTCSFIDRQIMALMVDPIKQDLHLSDTEVGILIGPAFAFFFVVMGLPMGALADRFSRKALITAGAAAWSAFTAACGLTSNFPQLLAVRMGVGVGEATLGPAAYSIITDYFPPDRLARAMSVFGLGVVIGSGLASLIGGYLIAALDRAPAIRFPLLAGLHTWQLVFLIVGISGLLLLLPMLLVREPARRQPPLHKLATIDTTRQGSLPKQLRAGWRAYAAIMGAFGLYSLFGYGAAAWLPSYLMRVHHIPIQQVGLLIGLAIMVGGSIGVVTAGSVNDRLVRKGRIDAPFRIGIVIGVGFLTGGLVMTLAPTPTLAVAGLAIYGLFGATWSGIAAAALQLMTPATLRGRVSAVYFIVTNILGLGFGPLLMALSTDHIFTNDLAVGKAIALVGVIAIPAGMALLWSGRRQYLAIVAP